MAEPPITVTRAGATGAILVLGGYGGFGARLSRRLAALGHEILVAGRNLDRATAFCLGLDRCRPIIADRDHDIAAILAEHSPALVIDAAGPFQDSGYHVPSACIAARIPYLDLADGRDFVAGIGELDAAARATGVAVIAGTSSVPALSGAVVRHLANGMDEVTAVEMAISASNRATAGPSVAKAIMSYVGRPIRLWRGQRMTVGHGWQDMRTECFALADGTVLRRLTGLADVPDLQLLPGRLPGRPAVSFRAGTELGFQNRGLWLASWLVRWRWLASLRGLAGALLSIQRITGRLGTDRSAMVVRLFGLADGRRIERRWTLIASDGDGPEIPTLAAALLADRIVSGKTDPGARDAGAALELSDFDASFAALAIRHETREIAQCDALYARVMGDQFAQLTPVVAAMHGVLRDGGASGSATVIRGSNFVARIVATVMGFPPAGDHALHVAFSEVDGVETWRRDFAGQCFASELSADGQDLVERFGALRFHFDLPVDDGGLRMILRRWKFAHLPLPLMLAPRIVAREYEEKGQFRFDVDIALPLIGRITHYLGRLSPPPLGQAPSYEPRTTVIRQAG